MKKMYPMFVGGIHIGGVDWKTKEINLLIIQNRVSTVSSFPIFRSSKGDQVKKKKKNPWIVMWLLDVVWKNQVSAQSGIPNHLGQVKLFGDVDKKMVIHSFLLQANYRESGSLLTCYGRGLGKQNWSQVHIVLFPFGFVHKNLTFFL